jgi:hypothetical protein
VPAQAQVPEQALPETALALTESLPRVIASEPIAPEPARRTAQQRPRAEPAREAAREPARERARETQAPLATAQAGPGRTQCVESLQRASLGPLTAAEAAMLRKDCEP